MGRLDLYEGVFDQVNKIEYHQDRIRRVNQRVDTFTPETADRVTRHAQWWPGLEFGVIEALAKEGFAPDDLDVKKIAAASTAKAISEGKLFGTNGFFAQVAKGRVAGQDIAREQHLSQAAQARVPGINVMSPEYQQEALEAETGKIIERASGYRPGRPEGVSATEELAELGLTEPQREAAFATTRQLGQQGYGLEQGVTPLSGATSAVRALTTGLEAPVQELQGVVRNLYAYATGEDFDWESQSDLGIILPKVLRGESVDMGDALFLDPTSEVARERMRREADRGEIGGHNITLGRILADRVGLSPDTVPFDLVSGTVDAGAQILDPAVLLAGGATKVSRARKVFTAADDLPEAGLFRGLRDQFHGPTFDAYAKSRPWRATRQALAGETSARKIWEASGKRFEPALARRIAREPTEEGVEGIVRGEIGTQIRATPELDKIGGRLGDEGFRKLNPSHSDGRVDRFVRGLGEMLPERRIDTRNPRNAADNLDRFLREGKASDAARDEVFDLVAGAESRNGVFQAAVKAMDHEEGVLVKQGLSRNQARELTRMFKQMDGDANKALIDEIAADAPTRDFLISRGHRLQDLSPQLSLEHIDRYIPLPDIGRVKRSLRNPAFRFMTTNMEPGSIGKARWPLAAPVAFMEQAWKPAALIGRFPAWISRVLGEEQIRIATAGYEGINHPISYLAAVVGRNYKLGPAGELLSEPGARGARFVADDLEDLQVAVAKESGGGLINQPGAGRYAPITVRKGDPDFARSYGDQLAILFKSPESRQFLNTNADETVEWLFHGAGRKIRREMLEAKPQIFATKGGTRRWLQETLTERVNVLTGGDDELLAVARTGKFRGKDIWKKGSERTQLDKDFVKALEEMDAGPAVVKGFGKVDDEARNAAVRWLFAHTMTPATNMFSRVPVLKQAIWRETADLLPFATKEVQEQVLRNAGEAGLSGRMSKRVQRAVAKGADGKLETVEELDLLARGYAVEDVEQLLYNVANKGRAAEAVKVAVPFGNAYQEILKTWTRLLGFTDEGLGLGGKVAQFGKVTRRAQQVMEGARGESAVAEMLNGGIAPSFFFKDQFGEEVFAFPFSQNVTHAMTGVPVPLVGQVKSLNMVGDLLPGLGPVAAIPLQHMLGDKPQFDAALDTLLPFGAPGERDPSQAFNALSFAPSWMQKLLLAMSAGAPGIENLPGVEDLTRSQVAWDQIAWMNTQKDVMIYLASTGDYDTSTREGMQELEKDARIKAKDLYYIRAGVQFFAPAAPRFQFLVRDKTGRNLMQSAVVDWFYGEVDKGRDFDDVSFELIERFGFDAFSVSVPKTQTAAFGLPRTDDAGKWLKRNKGIRERYPATYGLFAPSEGEFDYSVLVEQYATGERDVLTPSEWLNLRNARLADFQYNFYADQLGENPTPEQQAWLRGVREDIDNDFPHSTTGRAEKVEVADGIAELRAASQDRSLRNNPVRKPIDIYFYYRDQAKAQAEAEGLAWGERGRSEALRPTREWLAGVAREIAEDHPQFRTVWDSLLSREVERELR